MLGLGPLELAIVLLIAVLLFGSRLPKIARSIGQAQNEFKKGVKDGAAEDDEETEKKA